MSGSPGRDLRRYVAEAAGTFVLVALGPGAAVVDRGFVHGALGPTGVALFRAGMGAPIRNSSSETALLVTAAELRRKSCPDRAEALAPATHRSSTVR